MNYQMDYFYGHEANQFTFFRIPKLLFSDERFIGLTSDAKILYGLMLDRMGLSVKNGWIDEKNHVYIYFTLEEAMEYMRIGKDKGVKLFAELDDEKGCGLIKKKKQGLGKPTLIYVMNFVSNITVQMIANDFDREDILTVSYRLEDAMTDAEVVSGTFSSDTHFTGFLVYTSIKSKTTVATFFNNRMSSDFS